MYWNAAPAKDFRKLKRILFFIYCHTYCHIYGICYVMSKYIITNWNVFHGKLLSCKQDVDVTKYCM